MSFTFRGDTITLKDKDLCLELSGDTMVENGNRFDFHHKTRSCFKMKKGQDLCHRYSFSSMKKFLCYSYNTKKYKFLDDLISVMYSYGGNPYQEDYDTASEIINNINSTTNSDKMVVYFNELLYVLNNDMINLRPGDARWNRSIRECYDPESWYLGADGFVIDSRIDVHLLNNLLTIPIKPSTIDFYTAQNDEGNEMLYSSNNLFPNKGADVCDECYKSIFLLLSDGTKKEIT